MSVMAAVAVGSAVVGAVGANKSRKDAKKQNQAALDANAYVGDIAKDQYETYKTTYRPLEQNMVAEAQAFDSPEAYANAASKAQATTSQQIGLAQERLSRTPGLDPTSGAAQAAQTKLALSGAALGATNQNAAREGIRDKAWARKMDALGLGKGLVTNASAGAANAARTSASLADAATGRAADQAAGIGALAQGIGQLGVKAYQAWNTPTTTPGAQNIAPTRIGNE
ncbi:MAG: hypothetical protein WKF61_01025 [Luteimonas sp.]